MAIIDINFKQTFDNYKSYFIKQYGELKYEKAYNEVVYNTRYKRMLEWSRSQRIAPNSADYDNLVNGIFYFMFKSNETTVLGMFIAIKFWNDNTNHHGLLLPDAKVNEIAKKLLHKYCFSLTARQNP